MQTFKFRIASFLVLLFVLSAAATYLMGQSDSPFVSLLMLGSPALAAIATSLLTKRSLGAIGWKPWPFKWLALGWLLPMLYAIPAYTVIWGTGLGSVPNPTFLERARLTLEMPTQPDWLVIVSAFGFITIINLLPNLIPALGEEIGWRGFLVPELAEQVGFRQASLISGGIWLVWHLFGFFTGAYGGSEAPLAYQLICFAGLVFAVGVTMAWLRVKSGSIWPVAIMHATHNGLIQTFLDRITANTGYTHYFIGEFGIALLPFVMILAIYCWRQLPNQSHSAGNRHLVITPVDPIM